MSTLELFISLVISYGIFGLMIFGISVGFALLSEKIWNIEEAAISFFTLLGIFPFVVVINTLEAMMSNSFSFLLRFALFIAFYFSWRNWIKKRRGKAVQYWKALKAKAKQL